MPITVTVLDTGGIQSFIFGSNVLRENIGASELVHRATRLWAFDALLDKEGFTADQTNINYEAAKIDDVENMYSGPFQADGSTKTGAEVLYAGGGNTVILFQGKEPDNLAKDFVYRLSCRILRDAPGINLFAAHEKYNWGQKPTLPAVIKDALKNLGALKGRDPGSLPALGFPVTAACTSTGLPANARHPDKKGKTGSASRASRQVMSKWNMADEATKRLKANNPDIERLSFRWPEEFDQLADLPKRDDSYIAVVHADGNGMGAKIMALAAEWSDRPAETRDYITAMRSLSTAVQTTAATALRNALLAVADDLISNDRDDPQRHVMEEDGQHRFPVRPIVFGGDDVTLVTAGPWGLPIAERYLAELEKLTIPDGLGGQSPPYACAGVAIVKTHYPFSQAYHLSETLIKGAKKYTRILAKKKASALDWHFTTTGLHGDLEDIRKREYTTPTGSLHFRPIMLGPDHTWRNWLTLTRLIEEFGESGDWQERRNKTLRLREALRGGPDRVAEFWAIFREEGQVLPTIPLPDDATLANGWIEYTTKDDSGNPKREWRSLYFDPIEIAEQFFELTDPQETA